MKNRKLMHLLSGWVDHTLDPEQEKELEELLRKDPVARKYYIRYIALHSCLHWNYASLANPSPQVQSSFQPPSKGINSRYALATAAIIMVFGILFFKPSQESLGTIEFADNAYLHNESGTTKLNRGDLLSSGTIRIGSASGSAQLRLNDETLITLEGTTSCSISEPNSGKKLELSHGKLSANVKPQANGEYVRVLTQIAELEIMGTVFSVEADEATASVTVDEGLVKLRRLTDGQTIDIPARHQSMASIRSNADLFLTKTATSGLNWRLPLNDLRGITKGMLKTDERFAYLTGEPYIAGTDFNGMKQIRTGIAVNGHLVKLSGNSNIHVRYRSENSPTLFLAVQNETGGFGGTFESRIEPDWQTDVVDGWRSATVGIKDFEPPPHLRHRGFTLENSTVTKLLVSVHGTNPLDVAEVHFLTH